MTPITTSGVLADLKNGYTRFKKDDKGYGSIEEKYGLTVDEVKELFKTPSLRAKKTCEPKRKLEIIDDLSQTQGEVIPNGSISPIIAQSQDVPEAGVAFLDSITPAQTAPDIVEEADKLQDDTKTSIFA